jgi:hypothetical protein
VVESKLGPLGTSATEWPVVPAPGDYDDGEFGGMKIGRGNRSTRRKPAPAPLCPPQIPLDQIRARARAAALGSQPLIACAMARPMNTNYCIILYIDITSFYFLRNVQVEAEFKIKVRFIYLHNIPKIPINAVPIEHCCLRAGRLALCLRSFGFKFWIE